MISYADFELAIARWKARTSGVPMPAEPVMSGAVNVEIPNATEPEDSGYVVEQQSGYVSSESRKQASGSIIISDSLYEPPTPASK
jgi:hypothetical protein